MAQSSAQRDPSMEEILASIRRIIEEGEEARKPAEARDEFEPTPIGPAANDAMRRPLSSAPELRKDVPAVEPVEVEVFTQPVAEPETDVQADAVQSGPDADASIDDLSLSLDDFVIDVDDMREVASALPAQDDAGSGNSAPGNVSRQAEQPISKRIEPEFTQPVEVEAEPAPQAAQPAQKAAPREEAPQAVEASVPQDAPVTADSSPASISQKTSAQAQAIATALQSAQKSPMLSHAVERQVAASFTELGEALAANRRRSLDQIAEDMLRPMLQEWLDNNLPTLVERLVREEIERVARGAA